MKRDTLHAAGALAICGTLILSGCAKGPAPVRVYKMGEQVQAGRLIYTIYETEWKPQLGDGPTATIPSNRFLIVRLSVTNGGAQTYDIPQMALLDSAGKSYPELAEAPGLTDWMGIVRKVQPARTEEGRVVFDVPMSAYKLNVLDEAEPGEASALIDMPLDFQALPQGDRPQF
jgi:hypothetical protein